jgi:hypothetical protein
MKLVLWCITGASRGFGLERWCFEPEDMHVAY